MGTLANYELVEQLGEGDTALVYLGVDFIAGEEAAIKVYKTCESSKLYIC